MDNYSYTSYPDSVSSSPRSREVDCENAASWDDQPPPTAASTYKVKFMCSYGGKITPRPHDNQLTYIGGDTKILAVDRHIKFPNLLSKLTSISSDPDVCFKYQLPGEDLDALISVTNDEDLEHMMLEYDRLYKGSSKPARLRLFLFRTSTSGNNKTPSVSSFGSNDDSKTDRQWFVDALNSIQQQQQQTQKIDDQSEHPVVPPASENMDFLFGLDKGYVNQTEKVVDEPPPAVEMNKQVEELQRLQIAASHEQGGRIYGGSAEDFYQGRAPAVVPPASAPGYWPERQMTEGQVYFIQTPGGVYQAPVGMRPVTGQVGQAYYGMQRAVPDVYREQVVYNRANVVPQQLAPKIGGGGGGGGGGGPYGSEGIGMSTMMRTPPTVDMAAGPGYAQVSYDGAGRPLYYTAPGGVMPAYQTVPAMVDLRQSGGALNQEGKGVGHVPQTSSM